MKTGIAILIASGIALSACATNGTPLERRDMPGTAATFSYRVTNPDDYAGASVQAEAWCKTRYGVRARYLGTVKSADGDLARFTCSPA